MPKMMVYGSAKDRKNFICVFFNSLKQGYDVCWNYKLNTPLAKCYEVSDDYDFGSISIEDAAVDSFINGKVSPGLSLKK